MRKLKVYFRESSSRTTSAGLVLVVQGRAFIGEGVLSRDGALIFLIIYDNTSECGTIL